MASLAGHWPDTPREGKTIGQKTSAWCRPKVNIIIIIVISIIVISIIVIGIIVIGIIVIGILEISIIVIGIISIIVIITNCYLLTPSLLPSAQLGLHRTWLVKMSLIRYASCLWL